MPTTVAWKARKTSQCPECRRLIIKFRHTAIRDYDTREILHATCFNKRRDAKLAALDPSTGQPS